MKILEVMKSKPLIYCDLDGVLADLFGYTSDFHNVESFKHLTKDQCNTFFSECDAEQLFANLPVFPMANKLLQMVVKMFGGYRILSSPLNFDEEGSIRGKKKWLRKNITVPADEWIFEREKYKYATQNDGTPNILIDDYKTNIDLWNQHGGIGIKWQANEDSLNELKTKLISINI
jgi:5'(3')-deoxyribonucleotidase